MKEYMIIQTKEIIRCKNCKYGSEVYVNNEKMIFCGSIHVKGYVELDFYCADGVKKDD